MRARFVGPDGVSFFATIDERLAERDVIQLLHVPEVEEPDWTARDHVKALESLRVESRAYRRELWNIPIGPLAAPLNFRGYDKFSDRYRSYLIDEAERIDVVYRFVA